MHIDGITGPSSRLSLLEVDVVAVVAPDRVPDDRHVQAVSAWCRPGTYSSCRGGSTASAMANPPAHEGVGPQSSARDARLLPGIGHQNRGSGVEDIDAPNIADQRSALEILQLVADIHILSKRATPNGILIEIITCCHARA